MAADQETALGAQPPRARRPAASVPSQGRAGASITTLLVAVLTVLALILRLYQLTRPGELLGVPQYDDGVYLGAAVRLLDGYAPYRDFAFVQPPGIVLLAVPLGLLAKLSGTASAMAVARVLTACVGAVTVGLAGWLVRRRGAVAVTLVCGILAVHPGSVKAASTLFLEPWLVLFCLLGAVAIFQDGQPTLSARRLFLGGMAIGFAGAVKAFAVFPALALLVVLVLSGRSHNTGRGSGGSQVSRWRPSRLYALGVIAGFVIPVLPFAVLAPHRFFYDVIVDQYQRTDLTHVSVSARSSYLWGTQYLNLSSAQITLIGVLVVALVLAAQLAAWQRTRRPPRPLDCFALLAAAALFVGLLLPADFYWHYSAAFAPFLALAIGLSVAGLTGARTRSRLPSAKRTSVIAGAVLITGAAGIALMTGDDIHQEHLMTAYRVHASVDRVIPSGACVLTDNPSLTIMADRFVSGVPGCSPLVDSLGTDLSLGAAHNALNGAGRYPAVRKAWLSAFRHAQYVWLYCYPPTLRFCDLYTNRRIPWTPAIQGYFRKHFHRTRAPKVFIRDGLIKRSG